MGPKTLDELLIVVPGLTRARKLNAETLRLLLDRQSKECTWCGALVGKGRSRWCSDECVSAFHLRCCPNAIRNFVIKRDGGVCQLCGFDTDGATTAHQRAIRALRERCPTQRSLELCRGPVDREYHYARRVYREVDHIVPVIEGGGLCPIEQYRLVCGLCHYDLTSKLAASRKGKRSRKRK